MKNRLGNEDNQQVLKDEAVKFGARVKQLRLAAGLTQRQLAERLSEWGEKDYHQTTVAKLETGNRPTSLAELVPLAVALGVSRRAFFDDPTPADEAAQKVRESEQDLLRLRTELGQVQTRFGQLRGELARTVDLYAQRVAALREFDTAAAGERIRAVEDLQELVQTLTDISADGVEEQRQQAEDLKDLADTLRGDQL